MQIITIQSEVWHSLLSQLQAIHDQISKNKEPDYADLWLNEPEVCQYLNLSRRTMSRMRKGGEIAFSKVHGQYFYTIGEIKRILDNRRTGTTADYLSELSEKGKCLVQQGKHLKSRK